MALDLNDKTSNANNLTNSNVGEYTSDFPFVACTEVGEYTAATPSYLTKSDSASLSLTGDFTLELWARFKTTPANGDAMTLLAKFNDVGGAKYSYIWQLRNSGNVLQSWANYSADGSTTGPIAVNWTPSTSTWYHMALTFTAATKAFKFYIGGAQQGTTQTGSFASVYDGTQAFTIGAWDVDGTPSDPLNGEIAEVRVWNSVRTVTEINDNKSSQLAPPVSGLVAYWPFQALSAGGGSAVTPPPPGVGLMFKL